MSVDPDVSAALFAALGEPVRLRLVAHLCAQGPQSTTRLTANEQVTRQAVTKHLEVLAAAGVVRGIRHGRERLWAIEPGSLEPARRWLDEISIQWDLALDRLRAHVEDSTGGR